MAVVRGLMVVGEICRASTLVLTRCEARTPEGYAAFPGGYANGDCESESGFVCPAVLPPVPEAHSKVIVSKNASQRLNAISDIARSMIFERPHSRSPMKHKSAIAPATYFDGMLAFEFMEMGGIER